MNKGKLVALIAEKTGLTKAKSQEVLEVIQDAVIDTVSSGGKVSLMGFGTFEPRQRQARVGHNPATGEKIDIPARRVPVFRASRNFTDQVNQ